MSYKLNLSAHHIALGLASLRITPEATGEDGNHPYKVHIEISGPRSDSKDISQGDSWDWNPPEGGSYRVDGSFSSDGGTGRSETQYFECIEPNK